MGFGCRGERGREHAARARVVEEGRHLGRPAVDAVQVDDQPDVREAVEVAHRAVDAGVQRDRRLDLGRGDGLQRHAVERRVRAPHDADRDVGGGLRLVHARRGR
jgi:hypothetical protein